MVLRIFGVTWVGLVAISSCGESIHLPTAINCFSRFDPAPQRLVEHGATKYPAAQSAFMLISYGPLEIATSIE